MAHETSHPPPPTPQARSTDQLALSRMQKLRDEDSKVVAKAMEQVAALSACLSDAFAVIQKDPPHDPT